MARTAAAGSLWPDSTLPTAEPVMISKLDPDPEYHPGGSMTAAAAAAA